MNLNKNLIIMIGLLIAVFLLWDFYVMGIAVLYPLKLLVVFFHESSHALMTLATGGEVKEFVINSKQGGHVLSSGGNRFWTLTSGYLGSLLWGSAIYLACVYAKRDDIVATTVGILIFLIGFGLSRDLFTVMFTGVAGCSFILLGKLPKKEITDYVLRFFGLVSMCYVPLDIWSDVISRSHLKSDAYMLADEIGYLPTIGWGILWLLISAIVIALTIKFTYKVKEV